MGTLLLLPAVAVAQQKAEVSGGLTVVAQRDTDRSLPAELTASLDLFYDWPVLGGTVWLYIEANSSPRRDGISAGLPEANADAGTALDERSEGRLQVSELWLRHDLHERITAAIGLLDASGYVDVSRIANDENQQFLGAGFVNNPAIEFPDYAIGVGVQRRGSSPTPNLTVVGSSSHGLADNPNLSYAELLRVREHDKGLFIAAAARWPGERRRLGIGVWINTAPHVAFADTTQTRVNRGWFLNAGFTTGLHRFNLRFGQTDRRVFQVHRFAALTYQYARPPLTVGVGGAFSWLSAAPRATGDRPATHLEAFIRLRLRPRVYLTPDIQWIRDEGLERPVVIGREWLLVALRLHAAF